MVIFINKLDIVTRKSYNHDIVFIISDIVNNIAVLQGIYVRLVADAPIDDLVLVDDKEMEKRDSENNIYKNNIISTIKEKISHITGKILHIDSDKSYLDKCLSLYNDLNIYAYGVLSKEEDIYKIVLNQINRIRPNIVVLTGHDSFNKKDYEDLNNYKHTVDYIKAVVKIREKYSLDDICIFAGACGSNFEALIASGANFASSIDRENIEAFDPAIIAILSAITPFNQIVDINSFYKYSKLKNASIGGIESYGKMRLLLK